MSDLIFRLKSDVENHSVLSHPWLVSRNEDFTLNDLLLWLSQEYFVSIGFVDWFLLVATQTKNQKSKIVLVENIWEELGEGNLEDTHVSILNSFLIQLGKNPEDMKILPETAGYLNDMKEIIQKGFFHGLGALGPANEYLLKLEYSKISNSYQKLKSQMTLPEGKFFRVNLEADEGHSKRMFDLIEEVAKTNDQKAEVISGNAMALSAREKFYYGLARIGE